MDYLVWCLYDFSQRYGGACVVGGVPHAGVNAAVLPVRIRVFGLPVLGLLVLADVVRIHRGLVLNHTLHGGAVTSRLCDLQVVENYSYLQ